MKQQKLLSEMLVLAATFHHGQFDRGGRPYFLHPLTVMHMLHTDDEELRCIALGHDLFEDTDCTAEDLIYAGMTDRVIRGIWSLTRLKDQDEASYRKQVSSNPDAVKVKMADLRHNSDIRRIKGLRQKDFERIQKYQEFYEELRTIVII